MAIRHIQIQNYKSLRDVSLYPTPLSVFIGPNAAGKSNFCDALDFLGEVYRFGLEVAVARKGGYENISYRRDRRSKAPIKFLIELKVSPTDWLGAFFADLDHNLSQTDDIILEHEFEFRAESQNIDAPFYVSAESLKVNIEQDKRETDDGQPVILPERAKTLLSYYRKGLLFSIDVERMRTIASKETVLETLTLFFDNQPLEERMVGQQKSVVMKAYKNSAISADDHGA